MTVALETARNQYTANGATTVFAYAFTVLEESDLSVYVDDTLTTSGFTVSGVGSAGGGNVTFSTAPASGVIVTLVREMDATRETDYQNAGDFLSNTVNSDFDRIWYYLQQLQGQIDNDVLRFNPSEPDFDALIESPVALSYLRINAAANGVEQVATLADTSVYAENTSYTPAGTGAVATDVQTKLRETQSFGDLGAAGDGTTNDYDAFVAAAAEGGYFYGEKGKTYLINPTSPITLTNGTVFDFRFSRVITTTDSDIFYVNQGAQLLNVYFDVTAYAAYSSTFATLTPTANVRGAQWEQPWATVQCEFDGPSSTTGTALKLDASTYYIEEIEASVVSYFGAKALHLDSDGSEFCNGNILHVIAHDSIHAIHEDATGGGAIAGNVYIGMAENNANNCEVELQDTANLQSFLLWDRSVLTFNGNNNIVHSSVAKVNDNLTDNGKMNMIMSDDCEYYYDKRSLQEHSDFRNNLTTLRGRGEFRTDFMTGVLPNGLAISYGGGSGSGSFNANSYGGSTKKWTGVRYVLTTATSTNDSADLKFSTTNLMTGHDPIYMCTALLTETADAAYQFGFYADSNNYIILDCDLSAGTITPKVKASGTETAGTAVAVTFGRIFFFRIRVSNTSVTFDFSDGYSTASNNVGDGMYNLRDNTETITTNIPTATSLAPRNYVETLTTAAKQLSILNLQVLWSHGYLVP